MKKKILETLDVIGPMTPKEILNAFHMDNSFEEISTALFDLMKEGLIDVTPDKHFYRSEDAAEIHSE